MKTLTVILAMCVTTISLAQNNNAKIPNEPIKQSEFSIGLKGGFGHSFMLPYSNYMFNSSWDAGISATYAPWKHFGVGLDALYSQEGAAFTYSDYSKTIQLNYVRVPVKAMYFFRTYEADFRPKISIGPTVGFLVNQSSNSSGANFIDVGANASLGFNYRIARAIWFNADASYYQGLVDVYDRNNASDLNSNIRLDLGICLGF